MLDVGCWMLDVGCFYFMACAVSSLGVPALAGPSYHLPPNEGIADS
jgi:hypothetical protein